jgi:hypothetical protein
MESCFALVFGWQPRRPRSSRCHQPATVVLVAQDGVIDSKEANWDKLKGLSQFPKALSDRCYPAVSRHVVLYPNRRIASSAWRFHASISISIGDCNSSGVRPSASESAP